jgi:hypothetical protein
MKAIVRKQCHRLKEAPLHVRKRTSREADRELDHLSTILGFLIASDDSSFPFSLAYWIARLRELRVGYALLPTQLARISALERRVEEFAERDNRDVVRSKRRVA